MNNDMPCWVYRSARKEETYLYLAEKDSFDCVPDALREQFGEAVLVLELTLDAERKLAREDVDKVKHNLRTQGYHLQLPPQLTPALYHGNPV